MSAPNAFFPRVQVVKVGLVGARASELISLFGKQLVPSSEMSDVVSKLGRVHFHFEESDDIEDLTTKKIIILCPATKEELEEMMKELSVDKDKEYRVVSDVKEILDYIGSIKRDNFEIISEATLRSSSPREEILGGLCAVNSADALLRAAQSAYALWIAEQGLIEGENEEEEGNKPSSPPV